MRSASLASRIIALLALTGGVAVAAGGGQGVPLPPAAADHHLHIQGPEVTAELRRLAAKSPEIFKHMNPALLETRTGADALRALDAAGIGQGVLLSEAYMFASRFSEIDPRDADRLTRLENEANVEAARMSHGRLLAFVGVNPLGSGAIAELEYWAGREGVSGVKVQLGNAGFDPRSETDIAKLAAFFDAAREARMPIVAHVRSIADYEDRDINAFIEKVLPHAGDLPIQIAHGGGYGDLDQATVRAVSAYAEAIRRGAPGTRNLVLDLALVVVSEKTDKALANAFVQAMRRAGMSRFVVGSDWPSVYPPGQHNRLMESQLPLLREEWLAVLANKAGYFK